MNYFGQIYNIIKKIAAQNLRVLVMKNFGFSILLLGGIFLNFYILLKDLHFHENARESYLNNMNDSFLLGFLLMVCITHFILLLIAALKFSKNEYKYKRYFIFAGDVFSVFIAFAFALILIVLEYLILFPISSGWVM